MQRDAGVPSVVVSVIEAGVILCSWRSMRSRVIGGMGRRAANERSAARFSKRRFARRRRSRSRRLGEVVVERAGIINIGLEGVILSGAFGALVGATHGGLAGGYAAAMACGVAAARAVRALRGLVARRSDHHRNGRHAARVRADRHAVSSALRRDRARRFRFRRRGPLRDSGLLSSDPGRRPGVLRSAARDVRRVSCSCRSCGGGCTARTRVSRFARSASRRPPPKRRAFGTAALRLGAIAVRRRRRRACRWHARARAGRDVRRRHVGGSRIHRDRDRRARSMASARRRRSRRSCSARRARCSSFFRRSVSALPYQLFLALAVRAHARRAGRRGRSSAARRRRSARIDDGSIVAGASQQCRRALRPAATPAAVVAALDEAVRGRVADSREREQRGRRGRRQSVPRRAPRGSRSSLRAPYERSEYAVVNDVSFAVRRSATSSVRSCERCRFLIDLPHERADDDVGPSGLKAPQAHDEGQTGEPTRGVVRQARREAIQRSTTTAESASTIARNRARAARRRRRETDAPRAWRRCGAERRGCSTGSRAHSEDRPSAPFLRVRTA